MDYRRYCRWAEWSLVALIVGLNVAVFLSRENPSRPNFLLTSAHDAQLLSAIVLITGWIVLGPGRLWIRLAASPFLVCLWLLPWNTAMQPRDVPAEFLVMLVGACFLLTAALRVGGLRIHRSPALMADVRGTQFSILGLILATTFIAIAIGALEAARPMLNAERVLRSQLDSNLGPNPTLAAIQSRGFVIAVMVAIAGLGGIWAVLCPGATWLRLMAITTIIPAAGLYLAHLSHAASIYVGFPATTSLVPTAANLAGALGAVAAFCGVCVLPLRFGGFRLWRPMRSLIKPSERVAEPFAIAKRVAAVVLLSVAVAMLPLGYRNIPQNATVYDVRLNVNNGYELIGWNTVSRDEQTPMHAMAQWINPSARWAGLFVYSGGSRVHVFSNPAWLEIPPDDVEGWSWTSGEPAVSEEKGSEHSEDQP